MRSLVASTLVPVCLALGGCGSYYRYYKPGVSPQQMRQDGFECKQLSRQQYVVGSGGMLLGGSEPTFEVWKECLEARGYIVLEGGEDSAELARAERQRANAAIEEQWLREVNQQWLQDEYKWLLAEKSYIDGNAEVLNRDRQDSPQRARALALHLERLAEYNRRLQDFEQRRARYSVPPK